MRSLTKIATLAAVIGAVTAIAAAQDAPPPAAPSLSVADMTTKAAALDAQMREDGRYMLHLRELAKKKQDVIKLTCVNDRLVELKAQQNIADGTNSQLQGALQKSGDERFQLFVDYQNTAQSIKTLREEAQSCIGEPELFKQESGIEVEHPPIIDEPPVGPPEPEVEAPGYASPFH